MENTNLSAAPNLSTFPYTILLFTAAMLLTPLFCSAGLYEDLEDAIKNNRRLDIMTRLQIPSDEEAAVATELAALPYGAVDEDDYDYEKGYDADEIAKNHYLHLICKEAAPYLFHLLAQYNRYAIMQEILRKLADEQYTVTRTLCLTAVDASGKTPLHHAVEKNSFIATKTLLENLNPDMVSFYIHLADGTGKSALTYAEEHAEESPLRNLFAKYRAFEADPSKNRSPIQYNPEEAEDDRVRSAAASPTMLRQVAALNFSFGDPDGPAALLAQRRRSSLKLPLADGASA